MVIFSEKSRLNVEFIMFHYIQQKTEKFNVAPH